LIDHITDHLLFGLAAVVSILTVEVFTGFLLAERRLSFTALFPFFVHALRPIRQPAAADFQIADAQLRKHFRNAAEHHCGQLTQHRKGMSGRVQANELIEHLAAWLVAAESMNRYWR